MKLSSLFLVSDNFKTITTIQTLKQQIFMKFRLHGQNCRLLFVMSYKFVQRKQTSRVYTKINDWAKWVQKSRIKHDILIFRRAPEEVVNNTYENKNCHTYV